MSLQMAPGGRSARQGGETHTCLPASAKLRPLRDQLILEPLNVIHSRHLVVVDSAKPLRGIVKAVGPGCYPKRYDHPDKHRRTKTWDSRQFLPTQVKVGDVVELGGAEIGGYAFEGFFWGDVYHIHCRELDVAGVLTISAQQARAAERSLEAP